MARRALLVSPNQWRGPLVVKPCLLGSVDLQFENYQKISDQLVFLLLLKQYWLEPMFDSEI